MSVATDIKAAMEAVPTTVSDFLTKSIPTIVEPSLPTDESSSILAMGVEAYNWCKILKQFEGWRPLPTLLRIGQYSNSAIASILLRCTYKPLASLPTGQNTWVDAFRMPGDINSTGALSSHQQMPDDVLAGIVTHYEAIAAWYVDCERRIEACELAYAEGLVMPYDGLLPVPIPPILPVPIDPNLPAEWYLVLLLARILLDENVVKWIEAVAKKILRRIVNGGNTDALLKMFQKFAFLKHGDQDMGMPDFTSLLRLCADKPLEIINSGGSYDVFLDTIVDEGEPPASP
jgi:hypothetical protein